MKRINITGISLVDGAIVVRTVEEIKRWWHRRLRYVGVVYECPPGAHWRAVRTGKLPSKKTCRLLDEVTVDWINRNRTATDHRGFAVDEPRQVSRPSEK